MYKKIILLFILPLFLFSCGNSKKDKEKDITSQVTEITGTGFSINVPKSWGNMEDIEGALPNVNDSKIELAYASDSLKYGFSENLVILSSKGKLNKKYSSKDYSIVNFVGGSKEYVDFLKLDSKDIEFEDGDKSVLYIFEAKYNIESQKFKYIQVGKICGNKGYLLTIGLPTSQKENDKYEKLLRSFTCKNKK